MTAQDDLRQAIQMMQQGQVDAAAGQLNRLANSPALDAKARAAAYVWLAESRVDRNFKVRCLERALEIEPDNSQIRQGLQQLRSAPAQPSHLPTMPKPRESARPLQQTPRVVGIDGGVNGIASTAFVGGNGLLATTNYAVGSAPRVAVLLSGKQELAGTVIRRYPLYDLAFISTPLSLARKPAVAPPSMATQNLAFSAYSSLGARLRGQLAPADRDLPNHWLTTNIHLIQIPDAGGNPLYDTQDQLVGILTRNGDGSGTALAIKISHILALADMLRRDRQLLPHADCCPACGSLTQAGSYGGRTCETCGAALSGSKRRASADPDRDALMQLYGENKAQPCNHCQARVGAYDGRCLRCGQTQISRAAAGG